MFARLIDRIPTPIAFFLLNMFEVLFKSSNSFRAMLIHILIEFLYGFRSHEVFFPKYFDHWVVENILKIIFVGMLTEHIFENFVVVIFFEPGFSYFFWLFSLTQFEIWMDELEETAFVFLVKLRGDIQIFDEELSGFDSDFVINPMVVFLLMKLLKLRHNIPSEHSDILLRSLFNHYRLHLLHFFFCLQFFLSFLHSLLQLINLDCPHRLEFKTRRLDFAWLQSWS